MLRVLLELLYDLKMPDALDTFRLDKGFFNALLTRGRIALGVFSCVNPLLKVPAVVAVAVAGL